MKTYGNTLTNDGDTKSLKLYVSSSGLSVSPYNIFKPSTIDVTPSSGS